MIRKRHSPYKSTVRRSRSIDNAGFTITFNHPRYLHDTKDSHSLKVRRGLGTKDEDQARLMGNQMDMILADPYWWVDSMREVAAESFDKSIVSAFYDGYEDRRKNPYAIKATDTSMKAAEEIGAGLAMAKDSVHVQIAQLATDRALLMSSLTVWEMSCLGITDDDTISASKLALKLSGGVIDKFVPKEMVNGK